MLDVVSRDLVELVRVALNTVLRVPLGHACLSVAAHEAHRLNLYSPRISHESGCLFHPPCHLTIHLNAVLSTKTDVIQSAKE